METNNREDAEYGQVRSDDTDAAENEVEHLLGQNNGEEAIVEDPAKLSKTRIGLALVAVLLCLASIAGGLFRSGGSEKVGTLSNTTTVPTGAPNDGSNVSGSIVATSIPTMAPTARSTNATTQEAATPKNKALEQVSEDDPSFLPHLPFPDDLHYRRVCTPVHSSILCLTLRFPFPVQPQDPQFDYPRPFDERFYEFEKSAHFIDGQELLQCRNRTETLMLSIDQGVKECLDTKAASLEKPDRSLVSVWTRRRLKDSEMEFYGTLLNAERGKRVDKYFERNLVVVLGASPSPPITKCLVPLFGGCTGLNQIHPFGKACSGHGGNRRVLVSNNWHHGLPMDKTVVGIENWYPPDSVNKNMTTYLKTKGFSLDVNAKELRKLTLIIDWPIAHIQNQNLLLENFQKVDGTQKAMSKNLMHAKSAQGRQELKEMGYQLEHIIVFDGMPQWNPSVTGAYDMAQKKSHSEHSFLENEGYPGWKPEYGSSCRGPLAPTSNLTATNKMARRKFEALGLDMKFYGRTWEFANQLWFHTNQWGGKGGMLDCTHGGGGMSCTHRYVLMAMIDDHFEDLEQKKS